MYRKLIILLLAAALSTNIARAQDPAPNYSANFIFDNFFFFAWEPSMTTGERYVDDFSLTGGTVGFRKMMKNNYSLGLDVSWNSYYEYKPYQTYHLSGNTDVTTDLYKYNYTLPIAVTLHNYFPVNGTFIP